MAKQNIYDHEIFFEGYRKIRDNEVNANNLFEIPALFSLLPELEGKRILDLGCGFGEHCKRFVECGAEKVIGVDISEKMLEIANLKMEYSFFYRSIRCILVIPVGIDGREMKIEKNYF